MVEVTIFIFLLGYVFIALEHVVKIDKAASALITGILCWTIFMLFSNQDSYIIYKDLQHHLVHISEIALERVDKVENHLKMGQKVKVKLIKIDDQGRNNFSIKALLKKEQNA